MTVELPSELVSPDKKSLFSKLFAEFVVDYPPTDAGRHHIATYARLRQTAAGNLADVKQLQTQNEDITDAVLLKLLPYADTPHNQSIGAWIHIAPALAGDIRTKYENAGHVQADDWPKIAQAILDWVQRCIANPDELEAACQAFIALPYVKGFQSGTMSHILNALQPEQFSLINSKPLKVINYLTDTKCGPGLLDYPQVNHLIRQLVAELEPLMQAPELTSLSAADRFDMFTHWLVAVKKFDFSPLQPVEQALAPPFDRIFLDRAEAEAAFNFLARAFELLGITSADDPRFALTLRDKETLLRFNFASWATLHFKAPQNRFRLGLALIDDLVELETEYGKWKPFALGNPSMSVYELPLDPGQPLDADLENIFEESFKEIRSRLGHWQASNLRPFNQPKIAAAILDPTLRPALFREGLDIEPIDEVEKEGYFTLRTLELLTELHNDPSKDHYQAYKADFVAYLEAPFQQLMHDVAATFPPAILEIMETQKYLFSRILKNDWGQGGAWDCYWGAFYPQGSKRIQDAQLLIWVDHRFFKCGFYIGGYGDEARQRFLRHCKTYYSRLLPLLEPTFSRPDLVFSRPSGIEVDVNGQVSIQNPLTWQAWLQDPEQSEFDVSFVIPWPKLLQYNKNELCALVARIHRSLFPLVLLATLDDPLPAVLNYLGLDGDDNGDGPILKPPYPLTKLASDLHLVEDEVSVWVRALRRKQQVVLYGPPGTGKTFAAQKLAQHLLAETDGFVELVQFHPSYAYEDFMQGIRPEVGLEDSLSYKLVPGRFMDFCRRAREREGPCVLIIDEINRANLSRVFGELMYLLEYRDQAIKLAGSQVPFSIPQNVFLIGTMNTADRSIALVDHALRRRFAFLKLLPNFNILRRFHQQGSAEFRIEKLIDVLTELNRQIDDPNYEVGVSFFLTETLWADLADIWQMEIEPYLDEYFFDRPDVIKDFRWAEVHIRLGL